MTPYVDVTLHITDCPCCGISFALPEKLYEYRRETGEQFYCAGCGEELTAHKERPLEHRQEEILRLHNEEQAEARAADGKPLARPDFFETDVVSIEFGQLRCKHCFKRFRQMSTFCKHMEQKHGQKLTDPQKSEIVRLL